MDGRLNLLSLLGSWGSLCGPASAVLTPGIEPGGCLWELVLKPPARRQGSLPPRRAGERQGLQSGEQLSA